MRQMIVIAIALLALPFLYAITAQTPTAHAGPPPPVLKAFTTTP